MILAANHMTAGRDSRLAMYWSMDYAYADSGLLGSLTDGNLDASERIATGSTRVLREIGDHRNSPAPALAFREGVEP